MQYCNFLLVGDKVRLNRNVQDSEKTMLQKYIVNSYRICNFYFYFQCVVKEF